MNLSSISSAFRCFRAIHTISLFYRIELNFEPKGRAFDIMLRLTNLINLEHISRALPSYPLRLAYAFVPQLLRSRVFHDDTPPARIYPTSWLDGLRGLAALCVFNYHFLCTYGDQTVMPWGDEKHRWLIELPIVRLPYLGLPMVNIFFIVAGYVIALKPLQLMQSKSNEKLLHTLCSSVFRRLFRLYLPVVASTLLVLLATRMYLMEFMRPHMVDKGMFPGTREKQIPRFDTMGDQLLYWYREMGKLTSVWDWRPFYPLHDPHLWTIQYEFRSSLVLYLLLLLVAKVRTYARLGILFVFSIYCLSWDRWEIVLYLWGSCLAQWDIIRAENRQLRRGTLLLTDKELDELPPVLSSDSSASPAFRFPPLSSPQIKRKFNQGIYGAGFVLALWLLSAPKVGFTTEYGYQALSRLIPSFYSRKEKFLPTLGSVLLLWLLTHCSPTSVGHRILNGNVVQYFARISFALYLVHGPLLHLYGYYVPILAWRVLDRRSTTGYCAGILIGWCVNLASALWAADVFHREVDLRCVRIAKWLEDKCFVKN